jgi:hypothetical protein
VTCAPLDRYVRIAARADAPVARAEVQFRADAATAWYAVRMTDHGGEWSAYLPRPTSALTRLEYRIVMTGRDASSAATAPLAASVAASCDSAPPSSPEASIVVTVPPGAPVVPPVPAGFSPAGVVAAEEKPRLGLGVKLAGAAAGVAVLGATAAAVAGSSSESAPPPRDVPSFRFNSITPAPGSTLFPTRDRPQVSVVLSHLPSFPMSLRWSVAFWSTAAGRECLAMGGFNAIVQRAEMVLTGILVAPRAGCGTQFDTDTLRIEIALYDETVYDETLALPYRFRP